MILQKKNPKTKAYVKYRKDSKGRTKILNVKQREPTKPFKGVKIKK